jgi:hypothetical protein
VTVRRRSIRIGTAVTVAVVSLSGCAGGGNEHAPATTTARPAGSQLEARLAGAGYTVRDGVATAPLRPRPAGAFVVSDVDWAVPGKSSFSVAVYVFRSPAGANGFAHAASARIAPITSAFRSFAKGHVMEVRGTHLYVGFTSMEPNICGAFGLCAAFTTPYSGYGTTVCSGPANARCIGPGALPRTDFERLIARAEGA